MINKNCLIFFLSFFLLSPQLMAEPLQDCFRYGTYGLVAGAIAGGASMAFSEDPGSRLTPIAKGASLGLYAGLFVAIYKNITPEDKEKNYEIFPVGLPSFDQSNKSEILGLAFHAKF